MAGLPMLSLLNLIFRLSNLYLVVVTGISLGGFYYLSTLEDSFTVKAGGRDFTLKELNFFWIGFCILMLYMASAIPAVMWIAFVSAAMIGLHAAFHDVIGIWGRYGVLILLFRLPLRMSSTRYRLNKRISLLDGVLGNVNG
jgi:hypothetical protein